MKRSFILLAALAVCGAAVAQETTRPESPPPSSAAPTPDSPATSGTMPTFESLDRNGDGQLTVTEAQSNRSLAANFSAIDKLGRGYITKSEYDSYKVRSGAPIPKS